MNILHIELPEGFRVSALSHMGDFWFKRGQGFHVSVSTEVVVHTSDKGEISRLVTGMGRHNHAQIATNIALENCQEEAGQAQAKFDRELEMMKKYGGDRSPPKTSAMTLTIDDLELE